MLKPVDFPKILYANTVNANPSILSFYTRQIVPRITKTATVQLAASKRAKGIIGDEEYEDDGNYGSAATLDVEVLQAISKRVHYGKEKKKHYPLWLYRINPALIPIVFPFSVRPYAGHFAQPREIRLRVQVPLRPRRIRTPHSDSEPRCPRRADHQTGSGEEAVAEVTQEGDRLRTGPCGGRKPEPGWDVQDRCGWGRRVV